MGLMRAFQDDVDDDWCSYDWGDSIEGKDAMVSWKYADNVAQQCGDGTDEQRAWDEDAVVVGLEDKACDMWHGTSDE